MDQIQNSWKGGQAEQNSSEVKLKIHGGHMRGRINSWEEEREKADRPKVLRGKRKSVILLGNEAKITSDTSLRIKWSQRGIASLGLIAVAFFIAARGQYTIYFILTGIFASLSIMCFITFYYNNISFAVFKLSCKQGNVKVILISGITVFLIDCFAPSSAFSVPFGFVYMLVVFLTVFLDAVI